jgi:succinate dehydrogenase/fumarate reductase flavoprotein subunit
VPVVVAGAGMAGLVAAARLRELGRDVVLVERGTRAGGSMLLSSCVPWRHREWEAFRAECPGGDPVLQRAIWERLDDGLAWLVSLGAPVVWEETGNPQTIGKRFDPAALTALLAERGGGVRLGAPDWRDEGDGLVLCTGGFAASPELVARWVAPAAPLRLRANPWSDGGGLRHALGRGAALTGGLDEFYGRNMADAAWGEGELVAASALYGRHARIFDEAGSEFFRAEDVSWSETNVVQATARRPGAKAFYLLDEAALRAEVRYGTVADLVERTAAEARVELADLPFDPPTGTVAAVRVVAAITHTIGGLRVDDRARVLDEAGAPLDGLYAAGVDAGGVATGGYASGLAQALVQGLIAAEQLAA